MGNEFIGKVTDSYKKGWARGAQELKAADLFTINPEELQTILVRPFKDNCFRREEIYLLHLSDQTILVYSGQEQIGEGVRTPRSVIDAIREKGGKAMGVLHSVHAHSGLLSLAINI